MKYCNKLFHNPKRRKTVEVFDQRSVSNFLVQIKPGDVISHFITLRPSKGNESELTGRCPFCKQVTHNSKHFRVSNKKRIWKCFECGEGGRVTGFIKEYFDIPFDEAINFISNLMGVKRPLVSYKKIVRGERLNYIDDDLPF